MDFNLFGKKKDSDEMKEAQEIKSATNENNSSSPPSFNTELNSNDNKMEQTQPQNNFDNPFANNSPNTQMNKTPDNDTTNNNLNTNSNPFENNDFSQQESQNNNQQINPNFNSSNDFQNTIPENKDNTDFQNLENTTTSSSYSKEEIQEVIDETVEKVIEERWTQLIAKVDKVVSWKEKQESQINLIKEDVITMKEGVEKLEKRLITKIESYDKNILDVNSEIKALEKVFQKITPTLVNNVNELSKITRGLKESKDNSYDEKKEDKDIE